MSRTHCEGDAVGDDVYAMGKEIIIGGEFSEKLLKGEVFPII